MVVGKKVKDCLGKNEGWGKWKKMRKRFPPFLYFPNSSVFIFFPLMDHEILRWYTIINKSVLYINKKNHSPLFLFFFSLSPFPFFFILLLTASFFFLPGTIPSPPSHSILRNIYPWNCILPWLFILGICERHRREGKVKAIIEMSQIFWFLLHLTEILIHGFGLWAIWKVRQILRLAIYLIEFLEFGLQLIK